MQPSMKELPQPYASMHHWRIGDFYILEPATIITNLAIAAVCFYAWSRLHGFTLSRSQKLANVFFLMMGMATIIGGVIGHGLLHLTGPVGKIPGWFTSMVAVAFFERGVIRQARNYMRPAVGNFFSILNWVEIAALATAALVTLNFRFVELHAAYGLLVVVFGFTLYTYKKAHTPYARHIFIATALGALAALMHGLKVGFAYWFNYNDVSHLFMMAAVWFYYLGVKGMDHGGSSGSIAAKHG